MLCSRTALCIEHARSEFELASFLQQSLRMQLAHCKHTQILTCSLQRASVFDLSV